MIRHVVLLTFTDESTSADRESVLEGLATLPGAVGTIAEYCFGTDLGLAEGNSDLAIVADFTDQAAYETYRDHPAHRAVITDRILPILAARSAAQFEY